MTIDRCPDIIGPGACDSQDYFYYLKVCMQSRWTYSSSLPILHYWFVSHLNGNTKQLLLLTRENAY